MRTALSGGIDEAETYGVRMMYLPFCQNDSLVARFVRLLCQKSFGISLVGLEGAIENHTILKIERL